MDNLLKQIFGESGFTWPFWWPHSLIELNTFNFCTVFLFMCFTAVIVALIVKEIVERKIL